MAFMVGGLLAIIAIVTGLFYAGRSDVAWYVGNFGTLAFVLLCAYRAYRDSQRQRV